MNPIVKDGGEQTIKCPDCNHALMHYRVYAPAAPQAYNIKATCPFCKSESFETKVQGLFWYGPIGKEEENFSPTIIEKITGPDQNNSAIFHVLKG